MKTIRPLLALSMLLAASAWTVAGPTSSRPAKAPASPTGTDAPALPSATAAGDDDGAVHGPFRPGDGDPATIFAPRVPLSHTPCTGGFAGVYPCRNVDLLSFLPLASMGCGSGNSLWGWTDPLTSKEYALMGCNNGIAFVDISDPEEPVYLGKLPSHTVNSTWRDVRVYSNHAYVISEASGHGMQIFDLTRLRTVSAPPAVTFTEDGHYGGFGKCHTIAINEETGFAFPVGSNSCSGGPHMLNIQNPTSPVFAGCVASDGYTHETQCVVYTGPDAAYDGHELCFSSNEDTITIVDVTNKSAPVQVSRTSYPGVGYTHQGWLTEDQRYFVMDDELDETNFGHNTRTRIFNVTDVNAPLLIGAFTNVTKSIDHNQYIRGNYLYQANYRSGLRILDISGIASATLTEEAYFDIYPTDDNPNFNGAWNNYPFFPSGTVIVSGIEQGLFVLHPTSVRDFSLSVSDGSMNLCSNGTVGTTVSVSPRADYTGSVTLSAVGLPAGAMAMFGANPVAVPGSTSLSITTTGVAPGAYSFTVHATDGVISHDSNIVLSVALQAPAAPTLLAPADHALDQSLNPVLQWTAVPDAATYQAVVSTVGFPGPLVYSQTTLATSVTTTVLQGDRLHYWRVRGHNGCGDGEFSAIRSFRTRRPPTILLVDDDDDVPDVRSYYLDALDDVGASYDVWNTHNASGGFAIEHVAEPDAATLANYRTVIWFSGDVYDEASNPKAGPSGNSETLLGGFLDGQSCLMLSSQDYYFDRGETVNPFMSTYLGIGTVTSDTGQNVVTGTGPVFGGLGPYTLAFPPGFGNFSDQLLPGPLGAAAFDGDNLGAGVTSNNYKAAYLGFAFEALPTRQAREDVLTRFLTFCGSGPGDTNGLTVSKTQTDIVLQWTPPQGLCERTDYAVYHGSLADLSLSGTHVATSLTCATSGTTFQVPLGSPALGTADYFLIVAQGPTGEGSYGRDSSGVQRFPSNTPCVPTQDLRTCF